MLHFDANGRLLRTTMNPKASDSYVHVGSGSSVETWYCAGVQNAAARTTGAPTVDVLRAFPFIAPAHGGVIDRLALRVSVLAALSVARLGIYTNTADNNLYPATRLVDSGVLDTSSTGIKTATISQALTPGALYWFVHLAGVLAPTIACSAVDGCYYLGQDNTLGLAPTVGLSVAFAYAALPTPFPAGAAAITAVPIPSIYFRFSS